MINDYWWVFILVIFITMLIYPNKVEKMKNVNRKNAKLNLSVTPILTNLNKLTSYYVGLN
jgi:hypothetical protein